MIFMIHPEHGATNVSDGDVEEHQKNGWKISTVDEWFRSNGKGKTAEPLVNLEEERVRRGRKRKA